MNAVPAYEKSGLKFLFARIKVEQPLEQVYGPTYKSQVSGRGRSRALADAMRTGTLSPAEYKRLTGDNECTTPELVKDGLQEIYGDLFPGKAVPC